MSICEKHFVESSFINETHHRLNPNAVPIHHVVVIHEESPTRASLITTYTDIPVSILYLVMIQLSIHVQGDLKVREG